MVHCADLHVDSLAWFPRSTPTDAWCNTKRANWYSLNEVHRLFRRCALAFRFIGLINPDFKSGIENENVIQFSTSAKLVLFEKKIEKETFHF